MKEIEVKTQMHPYTVQIEEGLLIKTGEKLRTLFEACRVALITDDQVAPLYASVVAESLKVAGFSVSMMVIEHGEASKNPQQLIEILEFMAAEQLTRTDIALALGGGVVGDITGLAASLYLRGIRYVQMPTTLLAAVDSSVGGKCAVDLRAGKNLAGSFWQPSMVLCDPLTLRTLSDEIFADGCAEVIKYAVLGDEALFDALATAPITEQMQEVIARCVAMKRDIVERDETEQGDRKLLNLGHTGAHAIEKCSNFGISHGKAVAIGMVMATRYAIQKGICTDPVCLEKIQDLLKKYHLPLSCSYDAVQLAHAARSDKKRSGQTMTLVLPKRIGECVLYPIPIDELTELFR